MSTWCSNQLSYASVDNQSITASVKLQTELALENTTQSHIDRDFKAIAHIPSPHPIKPSDKNRANQVILRDW